MSSTLSRRSFIRGSLYVAGAASVALQAGMSQVAAQSVPAQAAANEPSTVNLGSNTLSIGPSTPSVTAGAESIPFSGAYGGPANRAFVPLLSEQLGVPTEYISVYPGSGPALGLAVLTFTSESGSLVTADPTYEQAWRTAPRVGGSVIKIPQRSDFSHDVQAMCAADPNAGMIYICNPNNPTGAITTRADIEYAANNKPAGSILLVDEAYIDFSDNAVSAADLVLSHENVIVLRTFSKLYGMAGLRLGYAVAHPENLQKMNFYGTGSVSMPTYAAGFTSISDPNLVPERRADCRRQREETVAWLENQGYKCSISEANCFVVDIKRDGREFSQQMATHGVNIGRTWPGFETMPRVSVGTEYEMRRFREAFTAVMAGTLGPLPLPQPRRVALHSEDPIGQEHSQFVC